MKIQLSIRHFLIIFNPFPYVSDQSLSIVVQFFFSVSFIPVVLWFPSILSAFYFIVSLGLTLWWALGKHFGQAYLYIIRLLQIYSVLHLLIIYLYQYPFLEQSFSTPNTQLVPTAWSKIFIRNPCVKNENSSLRHHWIIYLYPFVILTLYWTTIYEHYLTRKYHQQLKNFPSSTFIHSQQLSTQLFPNLQSFQTTRYLFIFIPSPIYSGWVHLMMHSTKFNRRSAIKPNSLLVAFISFILE